MLLKGRWKHVHMLEQTSQGSQRSPEGLTEVPECWQVPDELAQCQSLAWVSLAGNACCARAPPPREAIEQITVDALGMGVSLGEGASGDVFAADMVRHPGLFHTTG